MVVGGGAGGGRRDPGRRGIETDPERWWRAQPAELRCQALKAFAAEAQCAVIRVSSRLCSQCGGKGFLLEMAAGGSGAVGATRAVCPSCRGTGKFAVIRYK